MTSFGELVENYRNALTSARTVLARINPSDLSRPTPCRGWDLRTLIEHMVGQNEGFAAAIASGDASVEAYAPRHVGEPYDLLRSWDASVQHLLEAADGAAPGRPVRLVEVATELTFPADSAIRMHLLDTVVHTWDVATALGEDYRPDPVLVEFVAAGARQVPGGQVRTRPGAAFAPARRTATTDPWALALAQLGRTPPTA